MTTHLKSFFAAVVLISFLSYGLNAAVKTKSETLTIQTAAAGEVCKNEIEAALITTTGVQCADLNTTTQKVNVKYDPSQVSPEQIRGIITNAVCK